jgi:putative transposase
LSLIVRLPFAPLITALLVSLSTWFRSRAALQLEILALRHQIGVLHRSVKRPKLTPADRFLWAWLCSVWQDWKSGVFILKAATVVGWQRKGFRLFWTWKIRRGKLGRPSVPKEVRELIRTMSRENPIWGAPRIYGELLKLGIEISETSVSKYMGRRRKPPSQTWEDLPRESCEESGVGGLLRRADDPVPDSVRVSGAGT